MAHLADHQLGSPQPPSLPFSSGPSTPQFSGTDDRVKEPNSAQMSTGRKNLLGDFTMRNVNREFEDF